ncbi:hypothetical protein SELMODRAFT_413956 [Selaginella moellendorffii]|uniref:Uncharacterized protein n=1 Tax=Selaginella moellendorffii TaxID=88036 RepID=D8RR61_SELML|nr:hypothetical protein SELMODRAFT_413956 [Selaginella moellendorffii]
MAWPEASTGKQRPGILLEWMASKGVAEPGGNARNCKVSGRWSAPEHATSKWYIVPSLTHTTHTTVVRWDKEHKLMHTDAPLFVSGFGVTLPSKQASDGLVDMAAKLAEGVSRMDRHFMVMEIHWQSSQLRYVLGSVKLEKKKEWKSATPCI